MIYTILRVLDFPLICIKRILGRMRKVYIGSIILFFQSPKSMKLLCYKCNSRKVMIIFSLLKISFVCVRVEERRYFASGIFDLYKEHSSILL